MNKTITWLLFAAVLAAWAGNYYVYQSHKLEKPLFLKHYYELPSDLLEHSTIYYITNRDSRKEPTYIETPDGMRWSLQNKVTIDEQGRLLFMNATIQVIDVSKLEAYKKPVHFKTLTIYYQDGTSDQVDIGEMIIHPETKEIMPMVWRAISGSNRGDGYNAFVVKRDVTLSSITHSFPSLISDAIQIHVIRRGTGKSNQLPLALRKGEAGNMKYTFKFPNRDPRNNDAYRIMFHYHDDRSRLAATTFSDTQPQLYSGKLDDYIRTRKEEQQR